MLTRRKHAVREPLPLPAAVIGHSIPAPIYATAQLSINTGQLHLTPLSLQISRFLHHSWPKTDQEGKRSVSAVHLGAPVPSPFKGSIPSFLPSKDAEIKTNLIRASWSSYHTRSTKAALTFYLFTQNLVFTSNFFQLLKDICSSKQLPNIRDYK